MMCTYRRRSRRTFWTCHILISICASDSDLDDGDNDDGDGDGDGDGDDDEADLEFVATGGRVNFLSAV